MTINPLLPPFAGQTVEVNYDGLAALNDYDEDGLHMTYTITAGDLAGATGRVEYDWQEVANDIFLISWQEADGATVVHVDDFDAHTSRSFYTTPNMDLYRLQGTLSSV